MNRTHRTIWSRRLRAWVAVSEHTRGVGKGGRGGSIVLAGVLLLAGALLGAGPAGAQLPTGGVVSAGSATITQGSATQMTIQQSSARAAINWQGFSIGAGKTVQFVQPSAASVALNRVTGPDPSSIQGALRANGQVFLVNPNGVLFSPTAQVSVGSLVASTRGLSDTAFMSPKVDPVTGKLSYGFSGDSPASVVNQGSITTAPGGFIAMLAARVVNDAGATISAPGGSVALGAGNALTLDVGSTVNLRLDATTIDALLASGGAVRDASGNLLLSAQGAQSIGAGVINQSGHVDATSLSVNAQGQVALFAPGGAVQHSGTTEASGPRGGRILLLADTLVDTGQWQARGTQADGGSIELALARQAEQAASAGVDAGGAAGGGTVRVTAGESLWLSGRLAAEGSQGQGGSVSVTAPRLTLAGTRLVVDGATGGGTARVGGGWQGGDADLANAQRTVVGAGAQLSANATVDGNGGTVVVWSEERTLAADSISARGAGSGNGGRVEVSSHGELGFGARVDVGAPRGQAGMLVLDPTNIVIADSPNVLASRFDLLDPSPSATNNFGSGGVLQLANGNFVVNSPDYDLGTLQPDAGAVRLYSKEGAMLGVMTGSQALDRVGSGGVYAVGTDKANFVVGSPWWDKGTTADAGALTWFSGSTQSLAPISALNSLIGAKANDRIGTSVTVLGNGNYVVASPNWGATNATAIGAVTYLLGNNSIAGVSINSENSLMGTNTGDAVGKGGVVALPDNSYVVVSPDWTYSGSARGAFTRIAPTIAVGGQASGVGGLVGTGNSLVSDLDNGGGAFAAPFVTVLPDGNYVATHPGFNGSRGAVTWMPGTSNRSGRMSALANVVGVNPNDQIGSGGITGLSNGSFVILSPLYNGNRGSAKWVAGMSVSGSNPQSTQATASATGTTVGDFEGAQVVPIPPSSTSDYVLALPYYDPDGLRDAGVVAVYKGNTGRSAVLTDRYDLYMSNPASAIIGQAEGDRIGSGGVIPMVRTGPSSDPPMIVILSPYFGGGKGAITLANGLNNQLLNGTLSLTSSTSIVGTKTTDMLGSGGGVALDDGNALVLSPNWSSATTDKVGAASIFVGQYGNTAQRGKLLGGTTSISTSNSMVGETANDTFGSGGIFRLPGGQYYINSPWWGATDTGAVTPWGDVRTGTASSVAGTILGRNANDQVMGSLLPAASGYSGTGLMLQTVNTPASPRQISIVNLAPSAGTPSTISYGSDNGGSAGSTVSSTGIAALLKGNTNVLLQASNDITVASEVDATQPTGSTGSLTLQAGRSILLNANLKSSGDVELIANDTADNGVVSSQRSPDPRPGGITMLDGQELAARNLTLRVREGLGAGTAGLITLGTVNATTLSIHHANLLPTDGTFSIGTKEYDKTLLIGASQPAYFDLSANLSDVLAFTSSSSLGMPVINGYRYYSPNASPAPTLLDAQTLALTGYGGTFNLYNTQGAALLLNGTGQVTPRPVALTGAKAYDGSGTFNATGITAVNVLPGDALDMTGSVTVTASTVNTYGYGAINPGATTLNTGNTNYALIPGSLVTLDITPRLIALSGTKAYDGTGLFAASLLTITNRVAGDNVPISGSLSVNGADRGTYDASAIADPGTLVVSNPNYAFTRASAASLKIDPRTLALTGFKAHDGNGVFLAANMLPGNLVAGDAPGLSGTLTLSATAPGIYRAEAIQGAGTLAAGNPNYVVDASSVTSLVIAPPSPIEPAAALPAPASRRATSQAPRLPLAVRGAGINLPPGVADE